MTCPRLLTLGLRRAMRDRGHRLTRARLSHGSATILVVVTLVLLAMLGAVYLQSMRFERQAYSGEGGNVDTVTRSVISLIQQRLKEDLVDKDNQFFNPQPEEESITGETEQRVTGADEPYDYPWTNPNATFVHENTADNPGDNRLEENAEGGEYDDMWLASSTPVFEGQAVSQFGEGNGVWPHITNLRGVFVTNQQDANLGTDTGDNEGGITQNEQFPTDTEGGTDPATDTDVTIQAEDLAENANFGEGQLVDADGDGIGDSKWQWAPLDQVGDLRYVMAVRIVDLSSMLNANTALSLSNDSGDLVAGSAAPRGTTPSEWDFGGFVNTFGGDHDELVNLLNYRVGQGNSVPSNGVLNYGTSTIDSGGSFPDRLPFWEQTARYRLESLISGDNFELDEGRHLSPDDEMELRFNNGLNRSSATAQVEDEGSPEQGMPDFLRNNELAVHYDQVDYSNYNTSLQGSTRLENFFFDEPRKWLTVTSGAVPYAPPITDGGYTVSDSDELESRLRLDINETDITASNNGGGGGGSGSVNIRDRIEDVYDTIDSGDLPAEFSSVESFAAQFAASIADYRDEDSVLTEVDSSGGSRQLGLEALPFITEVYVQGRYEVTNVVETNPGSDEREVTVELRSGAPGIGYAIEIRNPFNTPIELNNDNVRLRLDGGGTLDGKDLRQFMDDDRLDPKEVLVLWRASNQSPNDNQDDIREALVTEESGFTYQYEELDGSEQVWSDAGAKGQTGNGNNSVPVDDITVELEAEVEQVGGNGGGGGGGTSTVIYASAPSVSLPTSYEYVTDKDSAPSVGESGFYQNGYLGNGEGINAMTVPEADFQKTEVELEFGDSQVDDDETIDRLGEAEKDAPNAGNFVDPEQPESNVQLHFRNGDLMHVGEMAQIAFLPWDGSETIPGAWRTLFESPGDPSTFRETFEEDPDRRVLLGLDRSTDPPTISDDAGDPGSNRNVRPATLLLDQFTTLERPNDDLPDDERQKFVPGKLNLNTVPERVLREVLPVSEVTTGGGESIPRKMARRIVNWRQDPIRDGGSEYDPADQGAGPTETDDRYREGLAYVSELYFPLVGDDELEQMPGNDGQDNTTIDGIQVDYLPENSTQDLATGSDDGVNDDREEQILLTKWLQEMGTTRSDVFAAYIVVHGYPAGDFTANGGQPVESSRVIALFDRSNIGDTNNSAVDSVEEQEVRLIETLRVY